MGVKVILENNKNTLLNILDYTITALLSYCSDLEIFQEVARLLLEGCDNKEVSYDELR